MKLNAHDAAMCVDKESEVHTVVVTPECRFDYETSGEEGGLTGCVGSDHCRAADLSDGMMNHS